MQINLVGPSYKHPSQTANTQTCLNWYPSSPGDKLKAGRGVSTLLLTMGCDLFIDLGTDPIRGMKGIDDSVYVVCGNKFYKLTINNLSQNVESELLGTLSTETGNVIMTNNPYQVIILDGVSGYIYNYEFTATVSMGDIGGYAGDTYTLTINGVSIYSEADVATQLFGDDLAAEINTHSATTHVTASFVSGLLTLTGDGTIETITVTESGTGFVAGTDGITVDPGIFASGSTTFSQFQEITDPDFTGGTHVVFIDSYFIYNETNSTHFRFSAQNEGRIYDGVDVASAESKPDKIVALGQTKGELWIFGSETVEVWYDAGNAEGSPFSKRVGSDIDIGCKAAYSVAQVNNLLMWLDSRGYIVQSDISSFVREQSSGYNLKKVSDEAMDAEIASYKTVDDAVACSYNDRGHIMYEITFPSEKKTWVYDALTDCWHERAFFNSYTGQLEHSLTQFVTQYRNLLLGAGLRDGKIYLMSHDYLTDNGVNITRLRRIQPVSNDFRMTTIHALEIKFNTGLAPVTGDGSDPVVMLRYSWDSGYTWSNEIERSLGGEGEYAKRVTWNRLGSANEWVIEIKITDPIDVSINDATVKLSLEDEE